jgi:hypothetical protein
LLHCSVKVVAKKFITCHKTATVPQSSASRRKAMVAAQHRLPSQTADSPGGAARRALQPTFAATPAAVADEQLLGGQGSW